MSEIQRIITLVYILFQMGFSNEHYINLSSKQKNPEKLYVCEGHVGH